MSDALAVGPLVLRVTVLATFAAALAGVLLAGPLARRLGADAARVRRLAPAAVLVGLAAGRAVHVAANWQAYTDAPWQALMPWLPGFDAASALALAVTFVFWRLRRDPARGRALGALGGAVLCGALVWGGVAVVARVALGPAVLRAGDRVPDFQLATLDGAPVRWSSLAGHAVIINFWATWCPPCRREMPMLQALHARAHATGPLVLGIDVGEPRGVVAAFMHAHGTGYAVWVEPRGGSGMRTRRLLRRFGGVGLPTTVFVDRNGRVAGVHAGELDRALLARWVARLRRRG